MSTERRFGRKSSRPKQPLTTATELLCYYERVQSVKVSTHESQKLLDCDRKPISEKKKKMGRIAMGKGRRCIEKIKLICFSFRHWGWHRCIYTNSSLGAPIVKSSVVFTIVKIWFVLFMRQRIWPTNSVRTSPKKLLVGRKCLATPFRTNEFFLNYDINSSDVRIEWATNKYTHSTGTNCCEQN